MWNIGCKLLQPWLPCHGALYPQTIHLSKRSPTKWLMSVISVCCMHSGSAELGLGRIVHIAQIILRSGQPRWGLLCSLEENYEAHQQMKLFLRHYSSVLLHLHSWMSSERLSDLLISRKVHAIEEMHLPATFFQYTGKKCWLKELKFPKGILSHLVRKDERHIYVSSFTGKIVSILNFTLS